MSQITKTPPKKPKKPNKDKPKRPSCYDCEYRRNLEGSAHSRCVHPAYESVKGNPLLEMFSIFASVGRAPPMQVIFEKITVVGSPHGIAKGWFNHPFNFDPRWLDECTGFKAKEDTDQD